MSIGLFVTYPMLKARCSVYQYRL